jgi:dethiobiotin synthetase
MRFVVSGIGTGVGKTVASAIVTKALEAKYWKPVQSGDLHDTDSMKVREWSSCEILPERFALEYPASPHWSAEMEGVTIRKEDFILPEVEGSLVIEGAGGLMVPLNYNGTLYIDLFKEWNIPVIVVSRHYLGSINHSLLTIEALQQRNIPIEGILFNGEEHLPTETVIKNVTGVRVIGRIPEAEDITPEFIAEQAQLLRPALIG